MALRFNEDAYLNAYRIGEQNRRANLPDPDRVTEPLLKGIGLIQGGIDQKNKSIAERKEKAPELLIKLRENKVPAEDANQAVANYIRTGSFEIPSETTGLEPLPAGVEGPQRQVRTPIPFGKDTREMEANIELKQAQADWWKKRPAAGISKGDPREVTTSNLSGIVNALSKRLESEIPGSEGYNEALAEMQPYMEELNARLKRSSVQPPGEVPRPAPAPTAPSQESKMIPPKKSLMDRVTGVFSSKKPSAGRTYMESNSELNGVVRTDVDEMDEGMPPESIQQQDIDQARQAVSKGLVSREEALKRLRRKYGPRVNF